MRDYIKRNHSERFQRAFGARRAHSMMEATAGSIIGVGEVGSAGRARKSIRCRFFRIIRSERSRLWCTHDMNAMMYSHLIVRLLASFLHERHASSALGGQRLMLATLWYPLLFRGVLRVESWAFAAR